MTQAQLSALHHFALRGRPITFALVYSYFGEHKELRDRNSRFGERLEFVAREWKSGRHDFRVLIADALKSWPL